MQVISRMPVGRSLGRLPGKGADRRRRGAIAGIGVGGGGLIQAGLLEACRSEAAGGTTRSRSTTARQRSSQHVGIPPKDVEVGGFGSSAGGKGTGRREETGTNECHHQQR